MFKYIYNTVVIYKMLKQSNNSLHTLFLVLFFFFCHSPSNSIQSVQTLQHLVVLAEAGTDVAKYWATVLLTFVDNSLGHSSASPPPISYDFNALFS